ncbi:MAG: hypothetical protein RBT34_01935 [Anaerolineaceae bacterium]|jgi:hypothetical protein|nr:hypothetical protein [Anaerolineaceae bacterium]
MYPPFEENRKIFTNVIRKEPIEVIIQTTASTFIHGILHVQLDQRLKDEVDKEEPFVAITDATIFDARQQPLYEAKFLAVNRSQIVWLLPKNECLEPGSEG